MNRRLFSRKLAGVAAMLGFGGLAFSEAKEVVVPRETRTREFLAFDVDKVSRYEVVQGPRMGPNGGCTYRVTHSDGSFEDRISGDLLILGAVIRGVPVLVDTEPMGLVS